MDFISKLKDKKSQEKSQKCLDYMSDQVELERLKNLKKEKKALLRKLEAQALKE